MVFCECWVFILKALVPPNAESFSFFSLLSVIGYQPWLYFLLPFFLPFFFLPLSLLPSMLGTESMKANMTVTIPSDSLKINDFQSLLWIAFIYVCSCLCLYVSHMFMCPWKKGDSIRFPWSRSYRQLQASWAACWEQNFGLLEEQYIP